MYDSCSKLYSSANDATILLWDTEAGKPIKKFAGHQGWIWGMQYDPETTTLVSCSVDGSIRIWDPRTPTCEGTLANGREVAGISVDFNANRIVSGSFDSIVRLWDLRTHRFYASLLGHKDRCTRVDATENVIASASFDGTVILYNFA
jgi:WD40 repeat protein